MAVLNLNVKEEMEPLPRRPRKLKPDIGNAGNGYVKSKLAKTRTAPLRRRLECPSMTVQRYASKSTEHGDLIPLDTEILHIWQSHCILYAEYLYTLELFQTRCQILSSAPLQKPLVLPDLGINFY